MCKVGSSTYNLSIRPAPFAAGKKDLGLILMRHLVKKIFFTPFAIFSAICLLWQKCLIFNFFCFTPFPSHTKSNTLDMYFPIL